MKLRRTLSLFLSLASSVGLFAACNSDRDTTPVVDPGDANVFESDAPDGSSFRGTGPGALNAGAAESDATVTVDGGSSNDAAVRAIEEADVFKLEGNRLYALSQYGGLNIIDVSERDNLRLLGRKKVKASPFEMYVRDSIVFALYNGYGDYVAGDTDGTWNWVQTSFVMAFDTTDAAHPQIIDKFPIAGNISDSRIVGDILYVVGYEANGCWGCETGQHTTVLSLDVSSPSSIHQVDRLSFADDTSKTYSWKRSISVTDKRMYVAGPEWSNTGTVGSTIQVIDISDPTGDLVEGATVKVAGMVNSRWQMDESDGYLRVISQPGSWTLSDTVRIQTYKVDSATAVTRQANVAMKIPVNESLRSVRFDGKRAYAITAEQMDPLFTIDLSDPTKPRQAGELEMPGWVYHMEPRGDRMVSLGSDQGNANGAMAISLFDVSNLEQPKMLSRVNFGGDWANFVEGQDQIQKAFQVLDENQLILMPFTGSKFNEGNCQKSAYVSGIQLVDWVGDALVLRGVADLVGQPRRGFLFDDRLFALSEERLETFDIANRAKPLKKDSLKLAHLVESTVAAGDTIVKVAQDWYTQTVSLDTTTLGDVESPEELGHIDISLENNSCGYTYLGTVAASNNRVYLLVNDYIYDSTYGKESQVSRLITVDVSSAKAPKVIGEAALNFGEGWNNWYGSNVLNAGAQSVAVGNAFVTLSSTSSYDVLTNTQNTQTLARVLDVTDANRPKVTEYAVGSNYGTTGLFTSGSTVALGYYNTAPDDSERVRFYVDRFNVKDPAKPKYVGPVNVPGALVAFDASSSNVVTVDYKRIAKTGLTAAECYTQYPTYTTEYKDNNYSDNSIVNCYTVQQIAYLSKLSQGSASVLGSKKFKIGQRVSNVANGTDRLFMTLGNAYGYYGLAMDCMGCSYSRFQENILPLAVLGGLRSDEFALGTLDLVGGNYWDNTPMAAEGDRAVLSTGWQGKLVVVDGSDPEDPVLVREVEIVGGASHLMVTKGVGVASLYSDGVQTIPVAD